MAEKNIGREAVPSPFEMGPNTSFQKPARQMKQQTNLPRAAFQKSNQGALVVDSLLNFAQLGGSIYNVQMSNKIAEDKIIQSAQADLGLAPTDQATVAGYRAHAASMMQGKVTDQRVKLMELASSGVSKEEWLKAVQGSYSEVHKYLGENYTNYNEDKEMQKLLPLAFREMMPQLSAFKNSEDLRIMTEKGKTAAMDNIITQTKLLNANGAALAPEQLSDLFTSQMQSLRLTTDEKDSIVEGIVVLSNDPNMIEAAKLWSGDRKSSLFDRSGKIQLMEKKLKDQEIASKGIDYELTQHGVRDQAVKGALTKEEAVAKFRALKKESGGTYPHSGYISTTLDMMDRQKETEADISAGMKAFMEGDTYKLKGNTPKELEAIYDALSNTLDTTAKEEARAELPNGSETEVADLAYKKFVAKNQKLIQRSVEQGHIPKSLQNRLNQVAVINIAEAVKDQKREGGGVSEKLDPKIDKELQFVNSIPVAARQAILDSMAGVNKDVIEGFWNEGMKGVSNALAFDRAQRRANNPPPVQVKEINEAADGIVSSLQRGLPWLGGNKDYPDNQTDIVKKYVAGLLFNSSDPMGESTQQQIKHAVKSYAKTETGRVFLGMTPDKLYEMTKVDISHIDSGIDALIEDNMDRIAPTLDAMGIKQKDVTIMPVPEQGYFRLIDSSGSLLTTKRFKFSEIGEAANKASLKRQKEMLSWKKQAREGEEKAINYMKGMFK